MKPITHRGRSYTEFWAWFPTRTTRGQKLWMCAYYIRPGPNGVGIVLRHWDMLFDTVD